MKRMSLLRTLSGILLAMTPVAMAAEKALLIPLDETVKAPSAKSLFEDKGRFAESLLATKAKVMGAMAANRSSSVQVLLGDWWATESLSVKKPGDALFPEPEKDGVNLDAVYENNDPRWRVQPPWLLADGGAMEIKPKQVAYFYRTVVVDRPCTLEVAVGKAYGTALWLNDKKVVDQEALADAPAEVKIKLNFAARTNTLLVKLCHGNTKDRTPVSFKILTGAGSDPTPAVWGLVKSKYGPWAERLERDLPGGRHLLLLGSETAAYERDLLVAASPNIERFDTSLGLEVRKALGDGKTPAMNLLSLYEKAVLAREYLAAAAQVDTAPLRKTVAGLPAAVEKGAFLAELEAVDKGMAAVKVRVAGGDLYALIPPKGAAQGEGPGSFAALQAKFAEVRQRILFLTPLLDFDGILCVKQDGEPRLPANWAGNCSIGGFFGGPRGAEIAEISGWKKSPKVATVFRPETNRVIANLVLHWDGKRALFSMPDDRQSWQVYEMDLESREKKVLTSSDYPDIHNFDPCYLPNGKILFSSTRVYTGVPCVGGADPVANLHLLDPATGKVRRVCFDQEQDWSPTVMNSGKVMYTRWEYTDTAHYFTRILFTMNPDGTGQSELYGSGSFWPNSIFYARAIPGHPSKVVGIVSGHHGVARMGELVIFDPSKSHFEAEGVVQRVGAAETNVVPVIKDTLVNDSWPKYLHPYPLREDLFLVASKTSSSEPWGIWLVDTAGNRQLIHEEKGFSFIEPVAIRKTPLPPVLQDKVKPGEKEANVYLQDVYTGPGLAGIPRGEVKNLRLFTYVFSYNRMGGHQDVAYHGSWDVKALLGTVPVNEDGSAFFKIPANTPVSIQPLDREGKALQLFRSWLTGMPGENLSCVGCHEQQNQAFLPKRTQASLQKPVAPTPWYGKPRGFSFEREIQPVLDRKCIGCHDGSAKGLPNLTFRKGGFINNFPESYNELHKYVWRPGPESDYHLQPPMEWHADVSELMQILKKGHHGVKLDVEEWDRLSTWIDLNVPAIGSWIEYRPTSTNYFDHRREMLKEYAGVEADYEIIVNPYAPQTFIPPTPPKRDSGPVPSVTGWPFDGKAAASRQAKAGAPAKALDLGEGVALNLRLIPSGDYVKGDGSPDAARKAVQVSEPFWLGETEVTLEQYLRFDPVHENGYIHQQSKDHTTRGYDANDPLHPVIRVSWDEAMAYCAWLSKKSGMKVTLPTEDQWEWAARAGSAEAFWWGGMDEDFGAKANLADKSISLLAVSGVNPKPIRNPSAYVDFIPKDPRFNDGNKIQAKVGAYAPSPWGLKDMNGNVAEWTASAYDGYAEARGGGPYQTVRGGSWRDRPYRCTSSFRLGYRPWEKVFNVGFRVCVAK